MLIISFLICSSTGLLTDFAQLTNFTHLTDVKNFFTSQTNRGCEWPEGHPDESDFKFCGKDRFEDKPYCIDHCAVAYVIPEKEEEKQHVVQRV